MVQKTKPNRQKTLLHPSELMNLCFTFSFYEYLTLAPRVALYFGSLPQVFEPPSTPGAARNTFPNAGATMPTALPAWDKPLRLAEAHVKTTEYIPS